LGAPSGFQLQSSAAPSLAPASDTRKGNKQKKHLEILYPSINIDIAKIFSKGICKRHLVKWQMASGSYKRVYLPQIFSNVSKNFFFRKHLLSDFWGMLKPY
jgi:hypothetical protein